MMSGTHGDVYIGSPERRVLESQWTSGKAEPELDEEKVKAPLNKRLSNLSLQTSVSDPFFTGSYAIQNSSSQKEGEAHRRRASEIPTSQETFSTSKPLQASSPRMNDKINSSDRSQLVSRLCDRSKSKQLDGHVLHKRMKRDPKVQHQLIFRQNSIEQMINTQKFLFHRLPRDGDVKSGVSNGQSLFL